MYDELRLPAAAPILDLLGLQPTAREHGEVFVIGRRSHSRPVQIVYGISAVPVGHLILRHPAKFWTNAGTGIKGAAAMDVYRTRPAGRCRGVAEPSQRGDRDEALSFQRGKVLGVPHRLGPVALVVGYRGRLRDFVVF